MTCSSWSLGPLASLALLVVATCIGIIVLRRRAGIGTCILVSSLCCVTVAMLAVFGIARQRQAQRGHSGEWPGIPTPLPLGLCEAADSGDDSDFEAETAIASVKVRRSAEDEPARTVTIDSMRRGKRESRSTSGVARSDALVRFSPSDNPPEAARDRWTRLEFARSIGGCSLLLVLAYLFLDAGRRQRYIWPRRVAIAATFAAVCVVLWRLGPLM